MAVNLGTMTLEDLSDFLKIQTNTKTSFFHLNVQSARSKGDDLALFFDSIETPFNVIMLTETWYKDDDDAFVISGYYNFILNRDYGRGGGVSLQTNVSGFVLLSDYSVVTPHYEILCIRKNCCIYSVLYRPPNGNISVFINFLEELFCFANEEGCKLYLGGDFNINMLEASRITDDFANLLTSNNFSNVIIPPTRVSCSTSTLIDLFITNDCEDNVSAGVLGYGLSDHLPIVMFINNNVPCNRAINPPVMSQNISATTLEKFREKIGAINWSPVLRETDVDKCYNLFLDLIKDAYYSSFPYKEL